MNAEVPDNIIVLNDQINASYEPTDDQIVEQARWLGMDVEKDKDFFYIAKNCLRAPLPPEWKRCKTKDTEDVFYYNFLTGESSWENPNDNFYKELFQITKKKRMIDMDDSPSTSPNVTPSSPAKLPGGITVTTYEPSEKELTEYAIRIGMNPTTDKEFFYIAKEGLKNPLPPNWTICHTEDSNDVYYYNMISGESSWENPSDNYYKNMFKEAKSKKANSNTPKSIVSPPPPIRKTVENIPQLQPQPSPKSSQKSKEEDNDKAQSFLICKISSLEEDIKNKEKEMNEMKIKLKDYDKERDEYRTTVKGKENEINLLKIKIMTIEKEVKNREEIINDLHKEIDRMTDLKNEVLSITTDKKIPPAPTARTSAIRFTKVANQKQKSKYEEKYNEEIEMIKKAKEYVTYQNNELKKQKTKLDKDKLDCKNNKRDATEESEIKKYDNMKVALDNQSVELNKNLFHTLKIDSFLKKREQVLNQLKINISAFEKIANSESDDSIIIEIDKLMKELDEEMGKLFIRELAICNDCMIYGSK